MDREIVYITECIQMGDEDKKVYVEGKERYEDNHKGKEKRKKEMGSGEE